MIGESNLNLCALIFFVQTISAQCIGASDLYGYGISWGAASSTATPCGVWSATYDSTPVVEWAYTPTSILTVSNVPGLATTCTSVNMPAGTIAYEYGNAPIAIKAEDLGAYSLIKMAGPLGYGPGSAGPIAGIAGPYGSGIGYGPCGYNILY